MKQIKKKVILTVCKSFPVSHPRSGEPTNFGSKVKSGHKIHTIRYSNMDITGKYYLWEKRLQEINKDKKYLSLRQWKGRPYNSEQEEIARFEKIGLQKIRITSVPEISVQIDGKQIPVEEVAKNDGLSVEDFIAWFGNDPFEGFVIHFTDFRY